MIITACCDFHYKHVLLLLSVYVYVCVCMYVCVCEGIAPTEFAAHSLAIFFQGAGSVSVYTVKQPTFQPSDLRTSFCTVGLFL